ncbi:AAC(3) family N-acetyltransferase [Caballeronia sp. LP006]|uniref:AAC(3) family N-acetyltransferase n=1 Tax=Caballeronia sp. LP006 TaxID=3038552 RepID=UPI0028596743|nr:AAC(3) family N-acetyltransferase [Caballeronia sp. LP006]MDR5831971.1 AAC(3) family N-acetyltransferase [Caballeronia sp. LP006]
MTQPARGADRGPLRDDLLEVWCSAGLASGDTVLVHSSLRRLVRSRAREGRPCSARDVLTSLLAVLGEDGTLLLPTFNFDFTRGVPFDLASTPSQMGALTEAGRMHPQAVRTGHPIYSFVVLGAKAELFRHTDNVSGYSDDSPFGMLRRLDGKIAVLDLPDQNSMTFYHHVEEVLRVPYRYFKSFTAEYCGAGRALTTKTYRVYVRDIEQGVLTHVDPAGEIMWREGLYAGARPGTGNGVRSVRARRMFDFVADVIQTGKAEGLLYTRESR